MSQQGCVWAYLHTLYCVFSFLGKANDRERRVIRWASGVQTGGLESTARGALCNHCLVHGQMHAVRQTFLRTRLYYCTIGYVGSVLVVVEIEIGRGGGGGGGGEEDTMKKSGYVHNNSIYWRDWEREKGMRRRREKRKDSSSLLARAGCQAAYTSRQNRLHWERKGKGGSGLWGGLYPSAQFDAPTLSYLLDPHAHI